MITRRILLASGAALFLPGVARAAPRLRIGTQKGGVLVIVRQQRRLEALGLAPEWVEFTSGPPMLEALNAGAVDFGATGNTPPIFAQAAGSALVYVGAQPLTGVDHAILVRQDSPIQTLADLRGKRFAFTKGSSAHAMALLALDRAGLTPADIQHVNLQPADAGAAFRGGAIDAWAIWDPFYAIAAQDPATRVLTPGEGLSPGNSFFLASRNFAQQEPQLLQTILAVINEAAAWAGDNPEPLAKVLSEVTGVPLAAQRVSAARGVYAVQPLNDTIVAQQQEVADRFAALHILPARIDVAAAVWHPSQRRAEARP